MKKRPSRILPCCNNSLALLGNNIEQSISPKKIFNNALQNTYTIKITKTLLYNYLYIIARFLSDRACRQVLYI